MTTRYTVRSFLYAMVPTTLPRLTAVAVLSTILLVVPPRIEEALRSPAVPLTVDSVAFQAEWEDGGRSFLIRSGPWTYHTACPILWISRTLITTVSPYLPIEAHAVEGVSGPRTGQATRREFASGPMVIPPSTIRVEVPGHIDVRNVLGIVQDIDVPVHAPCANGYSGRYRMWEAVMPIQRDEERNSRQPVPIDTSR